MLAARKRSQYISNYVNRQIGRQEINSQEICTQAEIGSQDIGNFEYFNEKLTNMKHVHKIIHVSVSGRIIFVSARDLVCGRHGAAKRFCRDVAPPVWARGFASFFLFFLFCFFFFSIFFVCLLFLFVYF